MKVHSSIIQVAKRWKQHKYKQTIVNKKIISHKKGSMSNLLYGKVESYFALVKWIKIKGKPISIFPSVEKEIILKNNDRIFIKVYRTIIDTTCLIISYLFTLLLLFFENYANLLWINISSPLQSDRLL